MKKIYRRICLAVAMYVFGVALLTIGIITLQSFALESWTECAELFWKILFALSPLLTAFCAGVFLYWEERLPPDEPIIY